MAIYTYSAINPVTGKKASGEVESFSRSSAVKLLEKKNLLVLKCKEKKEIVLFSPKPRIDDLIQFFEIMGTMLNSGLSMPAALGHSGRNVKSKTFRRTVNSITSMIQEGLSLSEALGKHKDVFPGFVIEPLKVAETTGKLPQILLALSKQMKKRKEINSKVKKASIYPSFVLFFLMGLITVAINFVLPRVIQSIKEIVVGTEMPPVTALVISVSDALKKVGPYIPFVFLMLVLAFLWARKNPHGKKILDRIKLKIPHLKEITLYKDIIAFLRVMTVAVESGLPVTRALVMAERGVENVKVKEKVSSIRAMVSSGDLLSTAIKAAELDPYLESMADAGEASGTLDIMLKNGLNYYETGINDKIDNFFAFLEPLIIAFLGLIVLTVLLGALVPLWESMQYVGKAF